MTHPSRDILVVEDSPTQGQMAVADLRSHGYGAVLAEDGERALELLDEQSFDLVLTDVVMPGMDGYELCRRIKERAPDLPVVILTSLRDPLDVVDALQVGADNLLRKPYDREQLGSRIRTILHNRELRQSDRDAAGLELSFLDRRFKIAAARQQMLDLLVATFEDLVEVNRNLIDREAKLAAAHMELERQLRATELEQKRLRSVFGAAPEALIMVDVDGVVTDVSDSATALLGMPAHAIRDHRADEVHRFVSHDGRPIEPAWRPLNRALASGEAAEMGTTFDLLLERPDGTRLPVIARSAPVLDRSGTVVGAVCALSEISGLADYDPITKLPTQARFLEKFEEALGDAGGSAAVLAVVIDRFDRLREALSTDEVASVLRTTARSLRAVFDADPDGAPGSTCVGSLDNGTFAVLVPGVDLELDAVRAANRFIDLLPLGVEADGTAIEVTVNIGVGVAAAPGAAADAIAAAATTARRATLRNGPRIDVSDPAVRAAAADELRRERELRRAIDAGELRVHYQPEFDIRTERLHAVEALARWQHPDHGLLPPDEFIPLAERSGLVVPLGWSVLREACRQVSTWRRELPGCRDLTVAVNLSAVQVAGADTVDQVVDALAASGLPADALVLEVTETSLSDDPDATAGHLGALRDLGVRVAIDDYGTGYSTLLQLRRFPVDVLKVDRAFVAAMVDRSDDATIVASSIALGHSLGLQVVAEGVEHGTQVDALRAMGCDLGQGYWWSRPLPPAEFEAWWAAVRADEASPGDPGRSQTVVAPPVDQPLTEPTRTPPPSVGELRG